MRNMTAYCPFNHDGQCRPNCMLLLTAADADAVEGPADHGDGGCSVAVLASHVASERHYVGNYLIHIIGFDYRKADDDDR